LNIKIKRHDIGISGSWLWTGTNNVAGLNPLSLIIGSPVAVQIYIHKLWKT
jgi:hypothetical protein